MKRLLCDPLPRPNQSASLGPEESSHALQVLRLEKGTEVLALDGRGNEALCRLRVEAKRGLLELVKMNRQCSSPPTPQLVLEVSILKADAMSWVIEKAVELGAARIVPVESEFVVVKTKDKGASSFRERWQRIADQALKQCGRLWSVQVLNPVPLTSLLAESTEANSPRFVLDEAMDELTNASHLLSALEATPVSRFKSIKLLVGPEGGWGPKDRKIFETGSQLHRVHLGEAILRAETACIASLTLASCVLDRTILDKKRGSG